MWKTAWMLLGLSAIVAVVSPAHAQTATRAVGKVTEVWAKDDRYKAFHKELLDRFADTPALEVFLKEEQWVSVLVSTSALMPVILKARAGAGAKVELGDVVELNVADNASVPTYAGTSAVTNVLCSRSAQSTFNECSGKTEVGMWAADGKKVSVQRR